MRVPAAVLLLFAAFAARPAELPIFDAHVHYSHDAWEVLPPQAAIAILDRKSTRLNSSHSAKSRMPSSA